MERNWKSCHNIKSETWKAGKDRAGSPLAPICLRLVPSPSPVVMIMTDRLRIQDLDKADSNPVWIALLMFNKTHAADSPMLDARMASEVAKKVACLRH